MPCRGRGATEDRPHLRLPNSKEDAPECAGAIVEHSASNSCQPLTLRGPITEDVAFTCKGGNRLTPKLSRAGAVAWRLPVGGKVAGWFAAASMTLRKCRLQRIVRRFPAERRSVRNERLKLRLGNRHGRRENKNCGLVEEPPRAG